MPDSGFSGPEARLILRRERHGTIATFDRETGYPYASLVNFATDLAGLPIVFISALARHTRNILEDRRGSLMASAAAPAGSDVLTAARVTVVGDFEPIARETVSERYGHHHPAARMYLDFTDFSFWRLKPKLVHGIAGFGRIETLEPEAVFLREEAVSGFADLATSGSAHLNEDHAEALRLLGSNSPGGRDAEWRVTSIDPDGFLLEADGVSQRIDFGGTCVNPDALRQAFVSLVTNVRYDGHQSFTDVRSRK